MNSTAYHEGFKVEILKHPSGKRFKFKISDPSGVVVNESDFSYVPHNAIHHAYEWLKGYIEHLNSNQHKGGNHAKRKEKP